MRREDKETFFGYVISFIFAVFGVSGLIYCIKNNLPFSGDDIDHWMASIILSIGGAIGVIFFTYCILVENNQKND